MAIPIADHPAFEKDTGAEVSALAFSDDGLRIAVGNEDGIVKVYDIRYPVAQF